MDVVLRFAALRPRQNTDAPPLTLDSGSSFQSQVRDTISSQQPRPETEAIARRFADTDFVRDLDHAAHGHALADVLARRRNGELRKPTLVASAVLEAVGDDDAASFAGELARARDSVLAAYLLPERLDAGAAQDLVRGYTLADAVADGDLTDERIDAIVGGPMALPDFVVTRPDTPTAATPDAEERARELATEIKELAGRRDELAGAIAEMALHADDELELSEFGERRPLRDLYRAGVNGVSNRDGAVAEAARQKPALAEFDDSAAASPLLRASVGRNIALSQHAVEAVPDDVATTIHTLGLDLTTTPVEEVQRRITDEHARVGDQLLASAGELANLRPGRSIINEIGAWALDPVDDPERPAPVASAAPTTHTAVKPLGIADLMVVRVHIDRYERSEVAAVENVLPHEKLTHGTRRLDATESATTDEQETTDLRAAMQSTAEQTNEAGKVEAVGPGLGPLAAAGPTSFAKSVTDQVSSSSTNRVRRLSLARQVHETEETLEHVVDDSAASEVEYGVYQSLDKIYTARAYGNGARLLYDVIVPEPAALFRDALNRRRSGLPSPVRPAPFKLQPSDLTPDNWAYYAGGHHAAGVDAPPAAEVVVTEPFAVRAKDPFSTDPATCSVVHAEARTTRIPKGYQAQRYRVVVQANGFGPGFAAVSIGSSSFTVRPANGVTVKSGRLSGETESLPVAVEIDSNSNDWGVLSITIGVEVICTATDELMAGWQTRTHAQILDANQQRFRDYEQTVATRDATAKAFLQTLTPERKAAIVQTEVQRAALELLTGQSFAGFNAIAFDSAGFPYPDAGATTALAPYIRFFEQAIEWERLAHAFYPYFWGSETSWVGKLVASEPDTGFAAFMSSGAARVVLPVRPGYEASVERFLNTGTIPTTDELLDVGSPLWVSLIDELRHEAEVDDGGTPTGEPWEFRIAADLVRARPDGSMPRWTDVQGKWKESADPSF